MLNLTTITFLISGVVFEVLVLGFGVLLAVRAASSRDRWRKIGGLITAQMMLLFCLCFGAAAEHRYTLVSRVVSTEGKDRAVTLPAAYQVDDGGDPRLLRFAVEEHGTRREVAWDSRETFTDWQRALRQKLADGLFHVHDHQVSQESERVLSNELLDGDVRRKLLLFRGFDGTSIPAYVFEPRDAGNKPAVLVLPGHGRGIAETAGTVDSYQHAAALALAEAGFVTMSPEFRGFGLLGDAIGMEHNFTAYNALLAGSSYKALLCADVRCAFEVLARQDSVDALRIAVAGVSFGGEMAVCFAALDDRVACVVAQGYGGGTGPLSGVTGSATAKPMHFCHLIPGQNRIMNREDEFLLIAPRPMLVVRGTQEQVDFSGLQKILDRAYDLFDQRPRLSFDTCVGGHEFFVQPAVDFLRRHL